MNCLLHQITHPRNRLPEDPPATHPWFHQVQTCAKLGSPVKGPSVLTQGGWRIVAAGNRARIPERGRRPSPPAQRWANVRTVPDGHPIVTALAKQCLKWRYFRVGYTPPVREAFEGPVSREDPPAITRSTLLPCPFASTPVFLCEPVRPKAPPLGSVSKPIPGEFITFDPLSAPISGALMMPSDLHSPLGCFQPSGSKRSTGFTTTSPPHLTPDCLLLPVARSFDFRPGSTLETRLRPARLIVP